MRTGVGCGTLGTDNLGLPISDRVLKDGQTVGRGVGTALRPERMVRA